MKKFWGVSIVALLLCPTILFGSFASADSTSPIIQPQNIQTRNQLAEYVDNINNINHTIDQTVESSSHIAATITFSQYLSFDELQTYISNYDVELQQIQLRGIMEDGTRVTIATLTDKGMEYTENLMYTQAAEQNFNLVGITDVYAYISPNQIDELSNDNLTYLVDTSGNDSGNGITAVNDESGATSSSVFPKSLTWELEELGLL